MLHQVQIGAAKHFWRRGLAGEDQRYNGSTDRQRMREPVARLVRRFRPTSTRFGGVLGPEQAGRRLDVAGGPSPVRGVVGLVGFGSEQ